jgi:DNA (cytosine-5)-methyltransferase 1
MTQQTIQFPIRPPIVRAFLGLHVGELAVDNFAGGGGASTGMAAAIGRDPDIAINHNAEAIAMHRLNHPNTRHYTEDVYRVDPIAACEGRPVGLAWFSPDCTHHSKAKGGKPRNQKIRGLAWVAVRWAAAVAPRIIVLENVEEFRDWGPLVDGHPCPKRKGKTFRAFVRKLERLGYVVDHWLLKACDHGAPTTRRRMFLVARNDGRPIVRPESTHGAGLIPYRTAAEIIDWSIPCPSIFDRARPLADKTLARIARGIRKFVLESPRPFIVPNNTNNVAKSVDDPVPTITTGNRNYLVTPIVVKAKTHGGGGNDAMSAQDPLRTITASKRGEFAIASATLVRTAHGDVDKNGKRRGQGAHSIEAPLGTVCAGGGDFAIAVPYMIHRSNGERVGQAPRIRDIERPLGVVVGSEKHAVCAAFLAKHYGERPTGGFAGGQAIDAPTGSVTVRDHHSLVTAHVLKFQQNSDGQTLDEPIHTIMAGATRFAQVCAFLTKYQGTSTGSPVDAAAPTVTASGYHLGLVTVTIDGELYEIVDIGMRMLTPRELFNAQGFPPDYIIDGFTKTAQIRMCGNSVSPPPATATVRAQLEVA